MHNLFFAIVAVLVLASCSTNTRQKPLEASPTPSGDIQVLDDAINFFVIGDWGRNGYFHQKDLAEMMNEVGMTKIEPEFIVSTGDNFYPNGVASVNDPYWQTSFEQIYTGPALFEPWYVVLGNHDYRGSIQAQIDYTNISRRWTMPARYFYKDFEDDGITARMVFLDTNPFEDKYYEETKYSKVHKMDTVKQLKWMDSVLTTSTADWNVVVGHHPMYSGGKRREKTGDVRNHLEKVLVKHKPHLYFAGHEHDVQHIKPEHHTHHIISGAGSEVRPTGKLPISQFAAAVQSFVACSMTKEKLLVQFIDYEGNLLHDFEIKK